VHQILILLEGRRRVKKLVLLAAMLVMVLATAGVSLAQSEDPLSGTEPSEASQGTSTDGSTTAGEEDLVTSLVDNVNAFWESEFALRGYPYSPAGVSFIYEDPVDGVCGPFYPEYGPGYCPLDTTLYYPVDWLYEGRDLADYGEAAMGWAVAHELGHHAQQQLDALGLQGWFSIPLEQAEIQADCFAGAWARQAGEQFGDGGVEAVLNAMANAGGPGHGTSEERISAFRLGYDTGDIAQCLAPTETVPAG
jgi:predicted metalloprotease